MRHRIEGKIVLIGDATRGESSERFRIPGEDHLYPGIYAHAAGAVTLIDRVPLFKPTKTGRYLADLLLALPPLLIVASLRVYYRNSDRRVAAHRLFGVLTLLSIAVIIVSVMIVRYTHVMWEDFFVVAAALLIHAPLERRLIAFASWIRRVAPGGWRALVFERDGEDHR
jgi:CHASE2 domain-containing sensor protein